MGSKCAKFGVVYKTSLNFEPPHSKLHQNIRRFVIISMK